MAGIATALEERPNLFFKQLLSVLGLDWERRQQGDKERDRFPFH